MGIILAIVLAYVVGKVLDNSLAGGQGSEPTEGASDAPESPPVIRLAPGYGLSSRPSARGETLSGGTPALYTPPPPEREVAIPDPDAQRQALALCRYYAIEPPGSNPSGVDSVPGDVLLTVRDRERSDRLYSILCSDHARTGQAEIQAWYISDHEGLLAGVPNMVTIRGETPFSWGAGGTVPSRVRNRIWAIPGSSAYTMMQWVKGPEGILTAMGRPAPRWVMAYAGGTAGGPLVRVDRALTVRATFWKDILRPMLTGLLREAIAIVAGYLQGGPAGAVIGGVQEAVRIVLEAKRTGTISGGLKSLSTELVIQLQESGILDGVREDFKTEIEHVRQIIRTAHARGAEIRDRFDILKSEVDRMTEISKLYELTIGVPDPLEKQRIIAKQKASQVIKQIVAGQEGACAAFSSSVAGNGDIPWRLEKVTLYDG